MADKRTLIRRATFDLIGLPPTPEEVAAFEADKSPDAFAQGGGPLAGLAALRRALGTALAGRGPLRRHQGLRLRGRIAHYPYAYTYRDYVIRAFNEDQPYDQFIKEQLAADLLPPAADKASLAALGFLTLGSRFVNNINDIIDDRIDVICRGMMGLTVACARCHDHKFDPIPSRDYYSLYGVFASSMEPDQEPLLGIDAPEKARDEYLVEHKKRVEELDKFREAQEQAMATLFRSQSGDYLLSAYEAQQSTNKPDVDGVAHAHKLDPEMLRRWMAGLDGWRKSQPGIFAPWFALCGPGDK